VLKYLSRYTHRVAISNHPLRFIGDGIVRFAWKDYADHNVQKEMTLTGYRVPAPLSVARAAAWFHAVAPLWAIGKPPSRAEAGALLHAARRAGHRVIHREGTRDVPRPGDDERARIRHRPRLGQIHFPGCRVGRHHRQHGRHARRDHPSPLAAAGHRHPAPAHTERHARLFRPVVRGEDRLRRQQSDLEVLYRASQVLNASLDPSIVMAMILEQAAATVGAAGGGLYLLDTERRSLQQLYTGSVTELPREKLEAILERAACDVARKYGEAKIDVEIKESYRNMKYELDRDAKVVVLHQAVNHHVAGSGVEGHHVAGICVARNNGHVGDAADIHADPAGVWGWRYSR
jgi:hypothetical protein